MRIFMNHLVLILQIISMIAFLIHYINSASIPTIEHLFISILNIIVAALILTLLHKDK